MSNTPQYADLDDFVPENGPVLYALISLIPKARGIPVEELDGVKIDTWDDEGSTWKIALNGSGKTVDLPVSPKGDEYPNPSAIRFHAGTFLITVDKKALVLCHPDHLEWFVNEGDHEAAERWERAAIKSVYDRLDELGLNDDLPPVEEFIATEHREHFRGDAA